MAANKFRHHLSRFPQQSAFRFRLLALVAVCVACMAPAFACGIQWTSPGSEFKGVDDQGHVFLVEKLGDLDVGGGLKIPVQAIFKSNWSANSPYLGVGWQLPLLEANVVQSDEGTFIMRQPGGWYRTFYRTKENQNILDGGIWKAEIKGDQITAWANCGDKLVFHQGKLLSFSVKDRTFTVVYSGNRATELREGGATKLRVAWNNAGTEAIGLDFNGSRVSLGRAERPRVQNAAGKNLIAGKDSSLGSLSGPGLSSKTFKYSVDDKIQPTLASEGRLWTWNPWQDNRVISDGRWTYDIKPGAAPGDNAAITRVDEGGRTQFWHKDKSSGTEITELSGGKRIVTERFVKGALRGKIRKQEIFDKGVLTSSHSWIYDDAAKLVREILNGEAITLIRDDQNRIVKKVNEAGKAVWERVYDKEGRTIRALTNGSLMVHEFLPDGSRKEYKKDPETERVIQEWEFDATGKLAGLVAPNGDQIKVVYDTMGRREKLVRNGTLQELYVFEGAGEKPIKRILFRPDGKSIESIRIRTIDENGLAKDAYKNVRQMKKDDVENLKNFVNELTTTP
jgi:hypothetical protein